VWRPAFQMNDHVRSAGGGAVLGRSDPLLLATSASQAVTLSFSCSRAVSMSGHHTPERGPIGTAISACGFPFHQRLMMMGSQVAFLKPPVPGMPFLNLPVGSGSRRGIGTLVTGSQGKTGMPGLA